MRTTARRLLGVAACGIAVAAGITALSTATPSTGPASSATTANAVGWQAVTNLDAGLGYAVPPDWTAADATESVESSGGITLDRLADFGLYTCQGAEYGRAIAGSGRTVGSPADAATDLAATVAADQYSDAGQTAKVTLSRPTPIVRDGVSGVLIRAQARAGEDADPCAGPSGEVTVIALGTGTGVAVFVIAADTETSQQQPSPLLDQETARAIADTVRPVG